MSELEIRRVGPTSTLYASPRFSTVMTRLAPGHMLVTLHGYNDGSTSAAYYRDLDVELERAGFLHIYLDTREQRGISAEEREATVAWSNRVGDRYRGGHVLFSNRLIELAVAIVNMVLGGKVKTYSRLDAFEAAIRANVPGFDGLPTFDDVSYRKTG